MLKKKEVLRKILKPLSEFREDFFLFVVKKRMEENQGDTDSAQNHDDEAGYCDSAVFFFLFLNFLVVFGGAKGVKVFIFWGV